MIFRFPDAVAVAVMGLGSVGFPQAEYLIEGNVGKLIVSDMDQDVVNELIAKYPEKDITQVAANEILDVEADILCPCAIGGFLNEDVIDKRIETLCADITKKNLKEAEELNITPTENAYNSVESRIYV